MRVSLGEGSCEPRLSQEARLPGAAGAADPFAFGPSCSLRTGAQGVTLELQASRWMLEVSKAQSVSGLPKRASVRF